MGIPYYDWLRGDCGCGCNEGCRDINPCDCDSILLSISKLETNDSILQDEIDELSGKVEAVSATVDTKLDASAYTPVDLTDYATKEWVENKHYLTTVEPLKTINGESLIGEGNIVISGGSGGTVDAYTKTESDERFQPIGDYALKSEIPTSNSAFTNDMHYVTSAETANYVTSGNVETQIVNHFWCGTQTQWAQISGDTQPNILYLIHD